MIPIKQAKQDSTAMQTALLYCLPCSHARQKNALNSVLEYHAALSLNNPSRGCDRDQFLSHTFSSGSHFADFVEVAVRRGGSRWWQGRRGLRVKLVLTHRAQVAIGLSAGYIAVGCWAACIVQSPILHTLTLLEAVHCHSCHSHILQWTHVRQNISL